MKLIIFGPQGSGKGTQARRISENTGIPHITTGGLMREHINKKTPLGEQIKPYVEKGELVPLALNVQLAKQAIKDKKEFILDGFPRNLDQAKALDNITKIDKAILLDVPDEVSITRITGRRVCEKGHEYHVMYKKPKQEGVCDEDGLPLKHRKDDTPESIRTRLSIYHESTEPVVRHYEQQGLLVRIDGSNSIDEVWQDIKKTLNIF